jgi:NTP pyrophosphatase (non-canonical NTP hydrolase)
MNDELKNDDFTLESLRQSIDQFVNERDWKSYHTPKSLAIALSIEASELLEHFLFQKSEYLPQDPIKHEAFTDEMADIFIYLMSLVNALDLPSFAAVVHRKLEKNRQKYPIDRFAGDKYRKQ